MAKRPTKVVLEHRGPLTLRDSDYVTSGGEGSIYRSGQTIVKLYLDADKMARDGMSDKIALLSKLKHAGIIAPQGLVLDEGSGKPLGYYMPFGEGEPMSRVFVSDYRMRSGFGDKDAIDLAASMHEIVAYAHQHKALMIDANELNWLANFTKGTPARATVLDVDSWATGRWKASVIMPSIRDWNAKSFTELTDWFAWGVVAFQIFSGIHPYKGKLDGYKPGDMVQRMKDNASVFDKRVRLPHAVRDFSCIPSPLLDWFTATFQQGARQLPPSPHAKRGPAKAAQVLRAVTTATGGLIFEKLFERAGDPAVRVWANGAVRLDSGEIVDLETGKTIFLKADALEVVKTGTDWFSAYRGIRGGTGFSYQNNTAPAQTPLAISIAFDQATRMGERLFVITDREMVELKTFGRQILTLGKRWSILPNATKWFDDVAVQDVLGSAFVIVPVGADGIAQVRVPQLDGANVVAGKAGGRFASFTLLDSKTGAYRKLELTFDKTMTTYTPWVGPADGPEINMAIMPRGVAATIVQDGEIVIFVPTSSTVGKIQDRGITTDMKLANWGERVVYIHNGAVWSLKVAP